MFRGIQTTGADSVGGVILGLTRYQFKQFFQLFRLLIVIFQLVYLTQCFRKPPYVIRRVHGHIQMTGRPTGRYNILELIQRFSTFFTLRVLGTMQFRHIQNSLFSFYLPSKYLKSFKLKYTPKRAHQQTKSTNYAEHLNTIILHSLSSDIVTSAAISVRSSVFMVQKVVASHWGSRKNFLYGEVLKYFSLTDMYAA